MVLSLICLFITTSTMKLAISMLQASFTVGDICTSCHVSHSKHLRPPPPVGITLQRSEHLGEGLLKEQSNRKKKIIFWDLSYLCPSRKQRDIVGIHWYPYRELNVCKLCIDIFFTLSTSQRTLGQLLKNEDEKCLKPIKDMKMS